MINLNFYINYDEKSEFQIENKVINGTIAKELTFPLKVIKKKKEREWLYLF